MAHPAILISHTCTTGWTDWVHGDLWLCAEGILRVSLGWGTTIRHGLDRKYSFEVPETGRPTADFTPEESARLAGLDKRNHWITWDRIASARARGTLASNVVELVLTDGSTVKLSWMKVDRGRDLLETAFAAHLGDRFQSRTTN